MSNDTNDTSTPLSTTRLVRYFEYSQWDVYTFIMESGALIPAGMGVVGSIFILLIVWKLKPFNSTSLYILLLALDDLLVSVVRCLFYSPIKRLHSVAMCSTLIYVMNSSMTYSNFILVGWTIQRFIAIQFPLKVADLCSMKKTAIELAVLGLLAFGLNVPYSYVFTSERLTVYEDDYTCYVKPEYQKFIYETWNYVDNAYFIYVPMAIILIANVLIIYKLRQMAKRHKSMTSSVDAKLSRQREQRSATITLVTISGAFLLLHLPQAASVIYTENLDWANLWGVNYANAAMTTAILSYFPMYQNAINFILYCLTGRRFRNVFMQTVCPCRKAEPVSQQKPAVTASTGVYSVNKSVESDATSSQANMA